MEIEVMTPALCARIFHWFVAVLTAFAAPSAAAGQQPAEALVIQPPSATLAAADLRDHQSLDGAWHWSIDPFRDGVAGFHGGPPGPSTRRWADIVQAEAAAKNPLALFEFDMQRSPITHLPGSWIGHAPEMRHYQGLVWYQHTFRKLRPQKGKRTFLRFGAVDHCASVYLNGDAVGTHCGGFTPLRL